MKIYVGITVCFLIFPVLVIACQPSDQQQAATKTAPTSGKQESAQTDIGPELPASELTTKKGLEAEKAEKAKNKAIKAAEKQSIPAK